VAKAIIGCNKRRFLAWHK